MVRNNAAIFRRAFADDSLATGMHVDVLKLRSNWIAGKHPYRHPPLAICLCQVNATMDGRDPGGRG
jgi:hypothetical protein